MKLRDLRVLCTALGFTAVVIKDGKLPRKEAAQRALKFAELTEEFCRLSLPETFGAAGEENRGEAGSEAQKTEAKFPVAERMASAIVAIIREQGGCLPHELLAKGFTHEEIDRHWAMAKALAYVELNITDS